MTLVVSEEGALPGAVVELVVELGVRLRVACRDALDATIATPSDRERSLGRTPAACRSRIKIVKLVYLSKSYSQFSWR